MDFDHLPVMLDAVRAALALRPGGRWLDGTLGGGGHSEAILEETSPDGILVGIDRDPAALAAARSRLARFGERAHLLRGTFAELGSLAAPWAPFDGILLDLGVSSPQLDQGHRGFSLRIDGPVDMRMDPDQPESAASLIDRLDEPSLVRILRIHGEEPRARPIARAILAGRPWTSTLALADCIARASGYHGGRTHPATRTFQALRIVVNDEAGQLDRGLDAALDALAPGGRLAVISFMSLDDRVVKRRFRTWTGADLPKDPWGNPIRPPLGQLAAKDLSGQVADPTNPRARSARLRVFTRAP